MRHFVVSYDLHNQRTYGPVWKALESWNAVRLLESVWLVSMNASPGAIRDALKASIDDDDSLAVLELKAGSDWASVRAKQAGADWLTRNIKRY